MKKLPIILFLFASSVAASAQATDYRRAELFAGFAYNLIGHSGGRGADFSTYYADRKDFKGFEVSGVYNVHRFVGVKADFSATFDSERRATPGAGSAPNLFNAKGSLYNVLGGIQVKDNASNKRVKPFAHALAGVGHGRLKGEIIQCNLAPLGVCGEGTSSETGFAAAFGGGLDIELSDRVDFRAIQIDYNPIKFGGATNHNVRFGIGFVIK